MRDGLSRMGREHIHFAPLPAGWRSAGGARPVSGMRANCEVLVRVDVASAMRGGIEFYLSDNGVVLSPGDGAGVIPPRYFSEVVRRKGGQRLALPPKRREQERAAAAGAACKRARVAEPDGAATE